MIDRYVRLSDLEDMLENSQMISDGEFSGYCTEDISLSELKVQDVMPVIHAYWIECKTGFKCSNCKAREKRSAVLNGTHKFCYRCGAKMEGYKPNESDIGNWDAYSIHLTMKGAERVLQILRRGTAK